MPAATTPTKSVLIVEDETDVRESLAAILQSEGYSVVEAEHGRQALDRLRDAPDAICVILLDLAMPTMNGWAFRDEQLRNPRFASIPVIIVTADATAAGSAQNLGVAGAMTKPVDFDRLLAMIGRHC